MAIPAHTYGPKSLLAFGIRNHISVYREAGKKCKEQGMRVAYRACIESAARLRAEFRAARICN